MKQDQIDKIRSIVHMSSEELLDRDLSILISEISYLLKNKEFESIDFILNTTSVFNGNLESVLAILRTTYPARDLLRNYQYFLKRVQSQIDYLGRDSNKLLKGLFKELLTEENKIVEQTNKQKIELLHKHQGTQIVRQITDSGPIIEIFHNGFNEGHAMSNLIENIDTLLGPGAWDHLYHSNQHLIDGKYNDAEYTWIMKFKESDYDDLIFELHCKQNYYQGTSLDVLDAFRSILKEDKSQDRNQAAEDAMFKALIYVYGNDLNRPG